MLNFFKKISLKRKIVAFDGRETQLDEIIELTKKCNFKKSPLDEKMKRVQRQIGYSYGLVVGNIDPSKEKIIEKILDVKEELL